jgi:hypothetical protein
MHIFATLTCLLAPCAAYNITFWVVDATITDGIDLYSLLFAAEALVPIQDIYDISNISTPSGIINGKFGRVVLFLPISVPAWLGVWGVGECLLMRIGRISRTRRISLMSTRLRRFVC